jgi:hypothetical protein
MKKSFYFILLLAFQLNAQSANELIKKILKNKTEINLSKIPLGNESLFGFDSRNDFKNCIVGEPIKVITLSNNSWIELNEWRVPIVLNGKNKLFFTVQKNNTIFEVVDIGGVELAKEIQKTKINNKPIKYLIRLYNLHIDFVSQDFPTNSDKNLKILPLQSAKNYLNSNKDFSNKTYFSIKNLSEINKEN